MRPSVDELKAFYATEDGLRVARLLARKVAPAVRRDPRSRLLALGYCAPMLRGFDPGWVERLALVMPFAQGVHRFPDPQPNTSCLADECSLPFADALFDQAILCHALEFVEPPRLLLRELWRVMAPEGEAIVVVPNRTGVWTHFERAPFGNGRPYGRSQLERIMRDALFEPVNWTTALVAPPVRGLRWLDKPLLRMAPRLGGVHILVARKRLTPPPIVQQAAATVKAPAFGLRGPVAAAPMAICSRDRRPAPGSAAQEKDRLLGQ
jgi:SAM-dependent methyltransferase